MKVFEELDLVRVRNHVGADVVRFQPTGVAFQPCVARVGVAELIPVLLELLVHNFGVGRFLAVADIDVVLGPVHHLVGVHHVSVGRYGTLREHGVVRLGVVPRAWV